MLNKKFSIEKMQSIEKTAFVLVSDQGYLPKAKRTIMDVRSRGEWFGDLIMICIPPMNDVNKNFLDFYRVQVVSFPLIDTSILFSKLTKRFSNGDGREFNKILQWEKIHVFDPFFQKWDRIVFLDAGMRIFDKVSYLLELDYKGKILAPNDAGFYKKPEAVFGCQICYDDPEQVEAIKRDFSPNLLREAYFLNCIWIYDTSLLTRYNIKTDLIEIMNRYILCKNNEMTAMNLLFTFRYHVWREFPNHASNGKYLFEWCETNHPHQTTWRDYVCIKYPISLSFSDTI